MKEGKRRGRFSRRVVAKILQTIMLLKHSRPGEDPEGRGPINFNINVPHGHSEVAIATDDTSPPPCTTFDRDV